MHYVGVDWSDGAQLPRAIGTVFLPLPFSLR